MHYATNFLSPKSMLSVIMFLWMAVITGCATPTNSVDLMPRSFPETMKLGKIDGSVNVRTTVPPTTTKPTYKHMNVEEYIDNQKLKESIEKTIARDKIFTAVTQGDADYVLEVWVETIQTVLDIGGDGFVFDFMSVWRLTRMKDGEVLVCEYVKGHGGANGFAARAYPPAVSAATRDMNQKGLFAVTDQSKSHLSATSAFRNRPMLPAVRISVK